MNSETKTCQNCKQSFVTEPDDFTFYEKMDVPPPTWCPVCRKQRRMSWRNDMNLYQRTCDLCGKNIISLYSKDSGLTVYCVKCWWSDKWDPKDFAQEYDFSKPFFLQFNELQKRVPYLALVNDDGLIGGSVNCEYNQDFARSKNCYMIFIAWKLEDCLYGYYMVDGKYLVDCLHILNSNSYVYEGIFIEDCYQCRYVYDSVALSDCSFAYDCRDCSDCLLCVGLRHQRYCFKNKQYSKEEYEKILSGYKLNTFSGVERARKEFSELLYTSPRRFALFRNTVSSTGDYLSNCKNSRDCFLIQRGENCRYAEGCDTPKDSYDLTVGGELSLTYEGITPDHTYVGRFPIFSWKNRDYYYVDGCHSSENIFGCVGLKKAQYCILNKQYTKEEYEMMLPKIIAHMDSMPYVDKNGIVYKFGEFYPPELSYFGYNESLAQDYFPLEEQEARSRGLSWRRNQPFTTGKETIKTEDLPDAIEDVRDSVTDEILVCIECNRNYRIISRELQFYRHMNIPLPRRCFFCRHKARLSMRNPFVLRKRRCDCRSKTGRQKGPHTYVNSAKHFHGDEPCLNEFETSYSPESPAIVYCEQCYQGEMM